MKTRILMVLLAMALLIPLSTLFAQEDADKGNLSGFVTDLITWDPVEGAKVCVSYDFMPKVRGGKDSVVKREMCDFTDETGVYYIEGIPAGSLQVMVKAAEYYPVIIDVEIFAGETTQADFELNPCVNGATGALKGVVLDGITGEFLDGAKVVVKVLHNSRCDELASGEVRGFFGETDENGEYYIDDIPVGEHKVAAKARGYEVAIEEVVIVLDETTTQNFELIPCDSLDKGRVSGIVTDGETAEPIKDAKVFIKIKDYLQGCGYPLLKTTTREDGSYIFDDVRAGTHRIVSMARGYKKFIGDVTVVADEITEFDIALEKKWSSVKGSVSGIVVDKNDNPVADVDIVIQSKKAPGSIYVKGVAARTDVDGKFIVENVKVGVVKVIAVKRSVGSGYVMAEVFEDETTDVRIVIKKGSMKE